MSIHDKINLRGAVDGWARVAIDRFRKALKKKRIGITGALDRSFEKQVEASGGDVKAVYIRFLMYGRFRDMGVGRGLKAYERHMNKVFQVASKSHGSDVDYVHRGPKRWFNKPKMAEIYKLRDILGTTMGDAVVTNLQEGFASSQTEYKIKL